MARTHGRIKVEVWDTGSDYRALSIDAQWAYQMLVSQPQVSMCGTLAYTPKKWAKLAAGLTVEQVEKAIEELEAGWYVIVDEDTDELLIRTFVKHDQPWKLPNLVVAARTQFRAIDSQAIRDYLAHRHEWLADTHIDAREYEEARASERASERTLPLSFERTSERASERPPHARAHTRTSPSPSPTPSPTPVVPGPSAVPVAPAREAGDRLPIEKEQAVVRLLAAIGEREEPERTAGAVRHYASQLPVGSIEKVRESLAESKPENRGGYAVGALQREIGERSEEPEPEPVLGPRAEVS